MLFVVLLIGGLLGTAAWVVLGSKLLVVREVEVQGLSLLDRQQVLDAARVPIGTPLARADVDGVRRRVAALKEVESVRIQRGWPTSLVVKVTEREPVASVQRGEEFFQIDRFGVTVLTSKNRPGHLPLLVVGAPGPGDPATKAGLEVLRTLPQRYASRLVTLEALSPESVVLRFGDGATVVWGAAERGRQKLRLLDALLKTPEGKAARTIDVSAPGVVTTR